MGQSSSQLKPSREINYDLTPTENKKNKGGQTRRKQKIYKRKYKPKQPKQKVPIQLIGQQENNKFILCRPCTAPDVNYQEWLEHFENQCNEQADKQWSQDIMNRIQLFEGYPAQYYQKEVQWIYYAYIESNSYGRINYRPSIIKEALESQNSYLNSEPQLSRRQSSYNSTGTSQNQLDLDSNNLMDDNDEQDRKLIKKLCKESCLIEEDQELDQFQQSNIQRFFSGLKESNASQTIPSFVYQANHNAKKDDPNNKDYMKSLHLYCSIMKIIKKHMQDRHCVLHFILKEFYKSFIDQYEFELEIIKKEMEHTDNKLSQKQVGIVNRAYIDLQQFIRVYQETIVYFYNLGNQDLKKQVPLFTRDNVINFITSNIFDNPKLYSLLFNLQKLIDQDQYINLKKIMENGLLLNQDDFIIPDKFQLNEKTYNYLLKKGYLNLQNSYINKSSSQIKSQFVEIDLDSIKRDNHFNKQQQQQQQQHQQNQHSYQSGFNTFNTAQNMKGTSNEYSINHNVMEGDGSEMSEQSVREKQLDLQFQEQEIEHTFGMTNNIQQQEEENMIVEFSVHPQKRNTQNGDFNSIELANSGTKQGSRQEYKEKEVKNIIHVKKNPINDQIMCQLYSKNQYNQEMQESAYKLLADLNKIQKYKEQMLLNIIKQDPFKDCITTLMKIETKINPISKLRVILKASEIIIKLINTYYNANGANFNNSIDSDDLVSIFNYITLKCNLPALITHCTIIERFSTNTILNSVSGYYLTTLQASLDYLSQNVNQNFMEKAKKNSLQQKIDEIQDQSKLQQQPEKKDIEVLENMNNQNNKQEEIKENIEDVENTENIDQQSQDNINSNENLQNNQIDQNDMLKLQQENKQYYISFQGQDIQGENNSKTVQSLNIDQQEKEQQNSKDIE